MIFIFLLLYIFLVIVCILKSWTIAAKSREKSFPRRLGENVLLMLMTLILPCTMAFGTMIVLATLFPQLMAEYKGSAFVLVVLPFLVTANLSLFFLIALFYAGSFPTKRKNRFTIAYLSAPILIGAKSMLFLYLGTRADPFLWSTVILFITGIGGFFYLLKKQGGLEQNSDYFQSNTKYNVAIGSIDLFLITFISALVIFVDEYLFLNKVQNFLIQRTISSTGALNPHEPTLLLINKLYIFTLITVPILMAVAYFLVYGKSTPGKRLVNKIVDFKN